MVEIFLKSPNVQRDYKQTGIFFREKIQLKGKPIRQNEIAMTEFQIPKGVTKIVKNAIKNLLEIKTYLKTRHLAGKFDQ